jgi:uroporphyrinogen decarboxylase
MADDQAMQSGPLFSMDLWAHYFQPRYTRLFNLVHDAGMKVYMHTCGHIGKHLPLLHQCGVDIIDNKQPELWMHTDEARDLKGKMAYSTCIDIQSRIHTVELDEIDLCVGNLIRSLATKDGGFIGTYYNQPDLKIPSEKIERMLLAFQKFHW